MKERSIAGGLFTLGLILGIVGWATSAYSAMTGTTIFLIFLFTSGVVKIALRKKEGGFLSARGSNLLTLAFMSVWAIYVIVMQATGSMGSAGSFIGLVVIGGLACTTASWHSAKRSRWLRKNSIESISTKKRLTHPIQLAGYALGIAALVIILLTFNKTVGYTAGAITLSVFIYVKAYFSILRNVNVMPV
ncbi:hypothetical protein ACFLVP_02740 [Chloroflexota bacterium]